MTLFTAKQQVSYVFTLLYDFIFKRLKAMFLETKIYGSFPQAKNFPSSRKFSTTIDISLINKVFHKPIFFFHQRSFPQAKIFPSSRKFSTSKKFLSSRKFFASNDFSLIQEVLHKQIFFLEQGSFPQAKIFEQGKIIPCSRNFSTSKDSLCDCNGTQTHNHLASKQTLNHLAKLAK